ncbi:MAG: hypothetical protein DMG80_01370 [Acidobacteria bacterium]|jgi:hypothetical protein|nr:MAG: hypothetical protein DMG80_01370 [Acidobacteriota bacterium]
MDRRKEYRLDIELSVRIWGVDRNARPFAELVRATSVSDSGAVLLDVHSKLHAGEVLDVQHEARKAQFRVVWTRPGEMGIQALPREAPIFAVGMPKTFEMAGTG